MCILRLGGRGGGLGLLGLLPLFPPNGPESFGVVVTKGRVAVAWRVLLDPLREFRGDEDPIAFGFGSSFQILRHLLRGVMWIAIALNDGVECGGECDDSSRDQGGGKRFHDDDELGVCGWAFVFV